MPSPALTGVPALPGRADSILDDLTPSQREAVTYGDGPLLVVAGAGSGKTRVITRRIAWLLARGLAPDRVVALTFTNKAADEMRRRVDALVGEDVYVTTFHSFCARLLRREIASPGRDGSFTIYDRDDSLRLVRQVVRRRELDETTYSPREVLDFIGLKKDHIVAPEQCAAEAVGITEQTAATVYADYQEALAENNALDFDDLLLETLQVFRTRPAVLQDYQHAYVHVLVDEYQDTNLAQHLIARALQGKHRNITAVGDPDQMIYSWRGARLENLLEFEEDFPGTRVVKLERNYRSSANILRAASSCIARNVLRHEKELWTEREGGEPVLVRGFVNPFDEGRWVARQVAELVQEGTEPTTVAVFYRTKQQSLPLEDAFAALALPHQVVDSVGFFDRKEVKDLRAYLQLMVNPRDDASCLRIINTPARGIGAKTLGRLRAEAARLRVPLVRAAGRAGEMASLDGRAAGAVSGFWELYQKLCKTQAPTVREIVRELLEQTGYLARIPPGEREQAQAVVDMFLGYARQYDERTPGGDLIGFLEQAALVSDVDGWNAAARAVPFMTLHSAKGLEFDVVFMVGVEENILPHRRALDDRSHGSEHAALEEERRLFYVGMTRARDRLCVSYARRRTAQGREQMAVPSRFLDELPQEAVEREADIPPADSAASFSCEMERVLERKRPALRILHGGSDGSLTKGTSVNHPSYGDGTVVEVKPMGPRRMVRVAFADHGTMVLLLGPEDVARA
jgi:DNA helicase-2/ATP-dependent DNA helicase PcrA